MSAVKRLGDILVSARAISAEARERAVALRSRGGVRIGTALLETGAVSEEILLRALSVQSQVPPAPARDLADIRADILRLVPQKLAVKLCAVPFRRSGRNLSVAMRDPRDMPAVDEISFLTGMNVVPHVALEMRLKLALERSYGVAADARYKAVAERLERAEQSIPAPPSRTATPELAVPELPAPFPTPPPADAAPRPPAGADAVAAPELRPAAAPAPAPAIHQPPPLYEPPVVTYRPPVPPPPALTGLAPATMSAAILDAGEDPWSVDAPGGEGDLELSSPEIVVETFSVSSVTVPLEPEPEPEPPAALELPLGEALPAPLPPPEPEPSSTTPPTGLTFAEAVESVEPDALEAEAAEPEAVEAEPEPPPSLDLPSRLAAAESRDDIADAVLDAVTQSHPLAGLFIVQASGLLGWAGRPEPPEGLRSFSLPFSEASVFATLRNTEGFYAGPCPDLPGNRKVLAALGAPWPATLTVLPVSLKGKSVLFLLAQAAEGAPPPDVSQMRRLATMTATALEIVLLRNRLRNL